jgi:hypothetical protein
MIAQVGYLVTGRSRGRVEPCAVCSVHVEMRSVSFLVEPQNQGRQFVSGLASKPLGRFSPVWPQNPLRRFFAGLASKPVVMVSSGLASKLVATVFASLASKPVATVSGGLASKPAATVSGGLTSKPTATFLSSLASKLMVTVSPGLTSKSAVDFLVEPQNQGGGGFPGLCLKTGSSSLVIWASKSPRRFLCLDLKIKWVSVYRLCHKTDGGRSAWDTHRDLAACFTWKQVWLWFLSLA